MKIAVDMDDVMVDFLGGVLKHVNLEFGSDLRPEDITDWNLNTFLDPVIGYDWWKWMRLRVHLWSTFDAMPGAIGGVERLRNEGHWMEMVTAKPDWAERVVWDWLAKWHVPLFNQVTVIDPRPKEHVSKADVTDADILIDDKPSNCTEFVEAGGQGILYTRPHNLGFDAGGNGLIRVFEWKRMELAVLAAQELEEL